RSKASFCPSAAADWAWAGAAARLASSASTGAEFLRKRAIKAFPGRSSLVAFDNIGSQKHKGYRLATRRKGAADRGVNGHRRRAGITRIAPMLWSFLQRATRGAKAGQENLVANHVTE